MEPVILSPELTNHCNFRCHFCPHSLWRRDDSPHNPFNRAKGHMSDELFRLVLDNAERYARTLNIGFFGEPLMHPRLRELLGTIPRQRSYNVTLNTNWSLVTEAEFETLKLVDRVLISLDATEAEQYDQLCPGGPVLDLQGRQRRDRFDTIVHKIERWLSTPDHVDTRLVYVVSSMNEHDRERFVARWQPWMTKPTDSILTKSVISYGGVMRDDHMTDTPCRVLDLRYFMVAWNGDCSPCNLDVNMALAAGNLLEYGDIQEIVESEPWRRARETIRRGESICRHCLDGNNWTENQVYGPAAA